jgi:hypothetical protein
MQFKVITDLSFAFHSQISIGIPGVPPPFLKGGSFEKGYTRPIFRGGNRSTKTGNAATGHNNIEGIS